jgi:hypothetical protein
MKGARQAALVCGFGDLAAGLGGLAWELGDPGALLLSEGEARTASFAVEEGGDAATVEIAAGDATLEATLTPEDAPLALSPGGPEVTACVAEMRSKGGKQTRRGSGQIGRWSGDPLEGSGTLRQIAIDAGEGALLVAVARGETGAEGHGAERTSAWRLEGEDAIPFEEALISTQYDGDGRPTRLGLELWPVDAERASRAAASRVSGSALGSVRVGRVWAGLFRCHTDGTEGLGSYILWRA